MCRSSENAIRNAIIMETRFRKLWIIVLMFCKYWTNSADKIIVHVVDNTTVPMFLDTGAKVRVLTAATWNLLGSLWLKKSTTILQIYSGQRLQVKGYFETKVTVKDHTDTVNFLVVDVNSTNIFGRDMLLKFPLFWNLYFFMSVIALPCISLACFKWI